MKNNKKQKSIVVKVNDNEFSEIQQTANEFSVGPSTFLRMLFFNDNLKDILINKNEENDQNKTE